LICEDGDWSALLGTYRNSIRKRSVYFGGAYKPLHIGDTSAGVFFGGITGYRSGVMPFGGFLVSHKLTERTALHLQVIPHVRNVTPTVLALSVSYKF
jgi:hypothetical protein